MNFYDKLTREQKRLRRAETIASYLPIELLEKAQVGTFGTVYINFPYKLETIKEVKTTFEELGFEKTYEEINVKQAILWMSFTHPDLTFEDRHEHITVSFSAREEGATCKVNLLRAGVEPVYEIVCADDL